MRLHRVFEASASCQRAHWAELLLRARARGSCGPWDCAPVPLGRSPNRTCAGAQLRDHPPGYVPPGAAIGELPGGRPPASILHACHGLRETPWNSSHEGQPAGIRNLRHRDSECTENAPSVSVPQELPRGQQTAAASSFSRHFSPDVWCWHVKLLRILAFRPQNINRFQM